MLSSFGKEEGGRETWLHNFLPELLKDDTIDKVHIFGYRNTSQKDHSHLLKKLDLLGKERVVPVILEGTSSRIPKFVRMFRALRKELKQASYESPSHVLAVGGMLETTMVRFITRYKNAIRVVWLRSIFTQEKAYRIPQFLMKPFQSLEKHNLNNTADIIIANGDDTHAFYSKYNTGVHVLKNAVNVDKWQMPPVEESDILNVAYIGRLSEVKGIESYFELAQRIKASEFKKRFVFHVVGPANNYLNQAEMLDKANVINFHGAIDNDMLPAFLMNVHVCVALTFVSEKLGGAGLSNALIEQMAAEKIILAWKNNAFNQILDNTCAYQVEQYDVEALTDMLIEIYGNQHLALAKAKKAKEKVAPFTMEAHVEKFKNILKL